jgi:ribosomal protein S12 methylthiotransferase accessory factor YcaO
MVRAVTEAVQARTIFIAGARDDLMRSEYAVLKRSRVSLWRAADLRRSRRPQQHR